MAKQQTRPKDVHRHMVARPKQVTRVIVPNRAGSPGKSPKPISWKARSKAKRTA
jgi:hypothetical protein